MSDMVLPCVWLARKLAKNDVISALQPAASYLTDAWPGGSATFGAEGGLNPGGRGRRPAVDAASGERRPESVRSAVRPPPAQRDPIRAPLRGRPGAGGGAGAGHLRQVVPV